MEPVWWRPQRGMTAAACEEFDARAFGNEGLAPAWEPGPGPLWSSRACSEPKASDVNVWPSERRLVHLPPAQGALRWRSRWGNQAGMPCGLPRRENRDARYGTPSPDIASAPASAGLPGTGRLAAVLIVYLCAQAHHARRLSYVAIEHHRRVAGNAVVLIAYQLPRGCARNQQLRFSDLSAPRYRSPTRREPNCGATKSGRAVGRSVGRDQDVQVAGMLRAGSRNSRRRGTPPREGRAPRRAVDL